MEQGDDLENCLVDRQRFLARRRLLDEATDSADNLARPTAILDDATKRLSRLLQICRTGNYPAQSGRGTDDPPRDRLVDFVGDRGRELAYGGDAVCMGQFHLHL